MATVTLSKNVTPLKMVVPVAMKLPRRVPPYTHNKHKRRCLSMGREEYGGL